MKKTSANQAMQELTMMLMYLSKFNEGKGFDGMMDRAWKGYDFGVINELDDQDYISQGSYRSKSIAITEEGITFAKSLLEKYLVKDWE